MCDGKKQPKPLTPREIAENASNWSFGADLGLLKYLEVFSEDLFTKATAVDNNVNKLLDDLDKASLSLDIVKNKFLSLSNTQFIESRVYEDDETAVSEENTTEEPMVKEETKDDLKLAVLRGIEMIDKYFDKVQVENSDSEGEGHESISFVLQPKDPYINRPLPYVIGTEKWNRKVHVGLEDSSESEHDDVSQKFSDTDSELDLPNDNQSETKSISFSEYSETDLNKLDQPVANSTFNDTNKSDYLGSSGDSLPVEPQLHSFAEQLSAKLSRAKDKEEPPVNTRPIQQPKYEDKYGAMFSDEPPPLDDYDDQFSPKSKDQGIFSGGDGLFDDLDDDEPFWGATPTNPTKKFPTNIVQTKDDDGLFSNENGKSNTSKDFLKELNGQLKKQKEQNLFEDEDEDEPLFGNANPVTKLPKSKPQESLFDDEEDEDRSPKKTITSSKADDLLKESPIITKPKKLDSLYDDGDSSNAESPKRKAPVGGIQIIKNPNIFSGQDIKKILKSKRQSSSDSSTDELAKEKMDRSIEANSKKKDKEEIIPDQTQKSKIDSLFGGDDDSDNDDLFKGDLFPKSGSNTNSKRSGGLFDDLESSDESPKMYHSQNKTEPTESKKASILFSTNEDSDSDDLFSSKQSKIITKDRVIEKPLVEENRSMREEPPPIEEKPKTKQQSLFDDFDGDDEEDDIFASNFTVNKKNEVGTRKTIKRDSEKKAGLFDDEDNLFSENLTKINEDVSRQEREKLGNNVFEDDSKEEEQIPASENQNSPSIEEPPPILEDDTIENVSVEPKNPLSSTARVPAIDIFDPTPPPDLGDWDTTSEANIFDDDIYSFDSENMENRSSIFDHEPPSTFNESGIVRDQSARLETDISSFYPYASSSRRFSGDLFNEEQSNDSLLTTKNAFRSMEPTIPAISENTEDSFSAIDITPSGKLEDLYSESLEPKVAKSVTFEDDLKQKGDQIVEEVTKEGADIEKVKPTVLRKPSLKKTVVKGEETEDKEKDKSTKRGEEQINRNQVVPPREETISDSKAIPGKLKHNLNINVQALLPGAGKPPKKGENEEGVQAQPRPVRPVSLDLGKRDTVEDREMLSPTKIQSDLGNVEILESVTKTRARGPVKRRPSTKRGREAIRNSYTDFTSVSDTNTEEVKHPNITTDEKSPFTNKLPDLVQNRKSSLLESNPAVPEEVSKTGRSAEIYNLNQKSDALVEVTTKTYSSDIFQEDSLDVNSNEDQSHLADKNSNAVSEPNVSTKRMDIFNDLLSMQDDLEESEVNRTAVVKSENANALQKKDLFADDTDAEDDGLFSTFKKNRSEGSKNPLVISAGQELFGDTQKSKKQSLFDDDEEDDLFGEASKDNRNNIATASSKRLKTSNLKKFENTIITGEDPLNALHKDIEETI